MKKTAFILALIMIFSCTLILTSCSKDNTLDRNDNVSTTEKPEDKTLENLEAEKNKLNAKIADLEEEKNQIVDVLDKSTGKSQDEIDKMENRISEINTEISNCQDRILAINTQIEELTNPKDNKKTSSSGGIEIKDKEEDGDKWGEFIPV